MILGFYILDFCIPDKLIAVELDGGWHDGRERYDERRDRFIEACGFTVIRIPNDQAVTFDLGCIFTEITKDVKQFRSALAKANSKRGTYLLSN
jgi:very-short-patch-repair endonuclease